MVNGYFDNASASFTDDGRCIVSLQHGGGDILRAAKVDMTLARLIADEFCVNLTVEFAGVLSVSDEDL